MTSASPRTLRPPSDSAMRLSGSPSKRSRNTADQFTSTPALAGRSGAMPMPARAMISAQLPSEPRRGQLAPPSASTVASARSVTTPDGVSNVSAPSSPQPVQRWRGLNTTPAASSRLIQARSSGDAFRLRGNTRPLEPTNVSCPSASHQARSSSGGNAAIAARRCGVAAP